MTRRASSIKSVSSVAVRDFLTSVRLILNLWAPGAFTFDAPCALSRRESSSSGVTNDSEICQPTRNEGWFEYFSRRIICSVFSTKKPFTK